MMNLTFGEQVKIILGRKGMTIKQLAEKIELHTGKPMSRQNLTQRLGRDNFQEKDMRLIAEILGCKFQLSIMEMESEKMILSQTDSLKKVLDETLTVGDVLNMNEKAEEDEPQKSEPEEIKPEKADLQEVQLEETKESKERELLRKGIKGYFKKTSAGSVTLYNENSKNESEQILGEINPYTGKEYKTNSVRMHPERIGYVQVYDQQQHKWNDMTEWAFLGYQERKKRLLGKDYEPPIYLD